MKTNTDSLLLRRALRGNALFSTLTGLTLLLVAGPLAPVLGVPALALRVVGLSLLPFAVGLLRNAARPRVARGEAWLAVVLDLTWVAGSGLLLAAELWPLRPAGSWTVALVALAVLVFALLQALGLGRAEATLPEASAP